MGTTRTALTARQWYSAGHFRTWLQQQLGNTDNQ